MIVLDTNVLSALMASHVDAKVAIWLNRQPAESIWTTAITVFEMRLGIERLPAGRRRTALERQFSETLEQDIAGRVLPFDAEASSTAARFAVRRQRAGRPVEVRDVQIAGIVLARNAMLATRNTTDFEGVGLSLVNPWAA
jgi:predicted nucleic acid-binding protein